MSKKKQSTKDSDEKLESKFDPYELSRESSLVTQAGLQTAIFFNLNWRPVFSLANRSKICDVDSRLLGSFCHRFSNFFLLLSLLYVVLALFLVTNTDKQKVTNAYLKANNNHRVRRLKTSVFFFLIAISLVFILVFTYIPVFCFSR